MSFMEAYFQTLLYNPNSKNNTIFTTTTIPIYQRKYSEYCCTRTSLPLSELSCPLKKKDILNAEKIISKSNIASFAILNDELFSIGSL